MVSYITVYVQVFVAIGCTLILIFHLVWLYIVQTNQLLGQFCREQPDTWWQAPPCHCYCFTQRCPEETFPERTPSQNLCVGRIHTESIQVFWDNSGWLLCS